MAVCTTRKVIASPAFPDPMWTCQWKFTLWEVLAKEELRLLQFYLNVFTIVYLAFDINKEHRSSFDNVHERYSTQGIPYNYQSIMHFDAFTYSKNEQPTITPRNKSIPLSFLGQCTLPNYYDYLDINLLYCGGKVYEHGIQISLDTFIHNH